MFEIKPYTDRDGGAEQLDKYVRWANMGEVAFARIFKTQLTLWRKGTIGDFEPFPYAFCSSDLTCLAVVEPPDENGVIAYKEIDLNPAIQTITYWYLMGVLAVLTAGLTAPFLIWETKLVATLGAAVATFAPAARAESVLAGQMLDWGSRRPGR